MPDSLEQIKWTAINRKLYTGMHIDGRGDSNLRIAGPPVAIDMGTQKGDIDYTQLISYIESLLGKYVQIGSRLELNNDSHLYLGMVPLTPHSKGRHALLRDGVWVWNEAAQALAYGQPSFEGTVPVAGDVSIDPDPYFVTDVLSITHPCSMQTPADESLGNVDLINEFLEGHLLGYCGSDTNRYQVMRTRILQSLMDIFSKNEGEETAHLSAQRATRSLNCFTLADLIQDSLWRLPQVFDAGTLGPVRLHGANPQIGEALGHYAVVGPYAGDPTNVIAPVALMLPRASR
ncbi:MAG: hypothetical protein V1735_04260 [Nanoarchaeota archaeon]